jgi:hypothetical protein
MIQGNNVIVIVIRARWLANEGGKILRFLQQLLFSLTTPVGLDMGVVYGLFKVWSHFMFEYLVVITHRFGQAAVAIRSAEVSALRARVIIVGVTFLIALTMC